MFPRPPFDWSSGTKIDDVGAAMLIQTAYTRTNGRWPIVAHCSDVLVPDKRQRDS